ncbi:glycosyltransferase family 2 protein [Ferdinandcohnia sp. Marseille-Q9671]
MEIPKISIITPSFNQGEFLEQTILSVINQGYSNLEYIIIDGGSTDNSVDIIKKYKKYISYWVSEPDSGHADALNKGFTKSTGEIMAWINSDDILFPNTLDLISEIFRDNININWITGCPTLIDESGRVVSTKTVESWNRLKVLSGNYRWIQQESTFWRRNLWEKSGGYVNTNLKLAYDLDLWLRYFRYEKLYSINTLLGAFRLNNKQKSYNNMQEYLNEANNLLKSELDGNVPLYLYLKILKYFFYFNEIIRFRNRIFDINKLFGSPNQLVFDRKDQKFK